VSIKNDRLVTPVTWITTMIIKIVTTLVCPDRVVTINTPRLMLHMSPIKRQ